MNKLNVLVKKGDKYHLTTTGVLFFAKNPNKFELTDFKVKLARFNGIDALKFIGSEIVEDSFLNILDRVKSFVSCNTRTATKIVGFDRYDIEEYPYEAIRESIVNALAHRDYTLRGVDISLHIFDDRIEILSPGKLKSPLTVDLLNNDDIITSIRRNTNICELFHFSKEMEQYGTGIMRIKKEMNLHGLSKPEFNVIGDFFKVTLRGPGNNILDLPIGSKNDKISEDYDLNDRQINILSYLSENKYVDVSKYCDLFNISRSTADRDLNYLFNKHYIKKIKKGRAVCFSLLN